MPDDWNYLAVDTARDYLSGIDFTVTFKILSTPVAANVSMNSRNAFFMGAVPHERCSGIMAGFHSRRFGAFVARWQMSSHSRAANATSGNTIVERNHRSVKIIASRKQCSIDQVMYAHNVTLLDHEEEAETPVRAIYKCHVSMVAPTF